MIYCGSCDIELSRKKPFGVGDNAVFRQPEVLCQACLDLVPAYERANVPTTATHGVTFYSAEFKPRRNGGVGDDWELRLPPLFGTSWTIVERHLPKFAARFPEQGR